MEAGRPIHFFRVVQGGVLAFAPLCIDQMTHLAFITQHVKSARLRIHSLCHFQSAIHYIRGHILELLMELLWIFHRKK